MTSLIRYAGYDPSPEPEELSRYAALSSPARQRKARQMFLAGKDTMEIAQAMNIKEHVALRWVTWERNREYQARHA